MEYHNLTTPLEVWLTLYAHVSTHTIHLYCIYTRYNKHGIYIIFKYSNTQSIDFIYGEYFPLIPSTHTVYVLCTFIVFIHIIICMECT